MANIKEQSVQHGASPKAEMRRKREIRTISRMISMYCKGNHPEDARVHHARCGELVCAECLELDEYAVARTENCRQMETKKSCEECENHCYTPERREQIRNVMRWSGPRMATTHPIDAIRHLLSI